MLHWLNRNPVSINKHGCMMKLVVSGIHVPGNQLMQIYGQKPIESINDSHMYQEQNKQTSNQVYSGSVVCAIVQSDSSTHFKESVEIKKQHLHWSSRWN